MHGSKSKSRNSEGIFSLSRMMRNLDNVQDALVVLVCIALLIEMILLLMNLFFSLPAQPDFKETTADLLFVLVLVELFRLLMVYLEKHHISVGIAVEVTIVSVLREIIVEGLIHMDWGQVLSVCGFLIAMAALLYVEFLMKKGENEPMMKQHHVSEEDERVKPKGILEVK